MGRTITTSTGAHPLTRLVVENIDRELARRKLSWNGLAALTGRAPSGLSFIRQGRRGVPLDTLALLSDALDVAPWRLLRPVEPCPHCHGEPITRGFMCLHCGATG